MAATRPVHPTTGGCLTVRKTTCVSERSLFAQAALYRRPVLKIRSLSLSLSEIN